MAKKLTNLTKSKKPLVVAQIMGKWLGGGVESVIMNYYRHIDRNEIQFDFICDADSTDIPYEEIEKLGGRVIICPPYQKLPEYIKFLTELFRKEKYQIVHSNINTLSVFPLYAAKKAGVPVRIAHSHNTSNPKEIKRNIIKNLLRPFSKVYATDYFACSELAGRYQFGRGAQKSGLVKIIPNAIDIEKFKFDETARKELRREFGFDEKDFVLGHVGRFVPQKNHKFLIKVFSEVKKSRPEAKLLLVGQGPLEEKIKEQVEELKLKNDVVFAGQRSDVNKLYSAMDVFVLPSLYEGFGMVAIEAQCANLPTVVSSRVSDEVFIERRTRKCNLDFGFTKAILNMQNRLDYFDISKRAESLQNCYLKETYE